MQQTPVHEAHNPELLQALPRGLKTIIEIGCSSGALAREYKTANPATHYHGVDIDPAYAALAARYCNSTSATDLDLVGQDFFDNLRDREAWVFGDTLEHLKDPWRVLQEIHRVIPINGYVVACIPNAQHWSVQARLATGAFRYEDNGLLDRTHLRWFTRQTMLELFLDCGFAINAVTARIFEQSQADHIIQSIGDLAELAGADPVEAMADARPLQYVIQAQRTA